MKTWWIKKAAAGVTLTVVTILVVGGVVMLLWNAIVPDVFGAASLEYWQAVGLFVLTQILFRGVGRWHAVHHHGARDRWKHKLEEKLASMSPEERDAFRAEWKRRCGWEPGEGHAPKDAGTT